MAKILIVEDDSSLAMSLEDDLKLEGYDVDLVRDGAAACQYALDRSYDLVLLDVMLPKKDGFEVCRDLRRNNLQMPVIMLTARSQDSEKVLGLEMGADDYITKPFNPRELRARIKAVLRRSGRVMHKVYSFGDVDVDFDRHEVKQSGELVPLTHTEFKLLEVLIRNRGRVLSRSRLLDEVWGLDKAVTDRAVDTHMANLRKKVEMNPSQPRFIITVAGTGYRFDE